MTTISLLRWLPGISLAMALTGPARADSLAVFPGTVETTAEYSGSGVADHTGGGFRTQLQPFDQSLGTLVSFTVRWDFSGSFDGTLIPDAGEGVAQAQLGGTFAINGEAFFGGGGASPETFASPGETLSGAFEIPSFQTTVAMTATMDPILRDAVLGSGPFTVSAYSGAMDDPEATLSFVKVRYGNVESLNAAMKMKVTVTYTYTPAAAVPAAGLKVTALAKNPASGDVAVSWTSTAGNKYRLDASANLTDWQEIVPVITAAAGETSATEPEVGNLEDRRFYRVRTAD